MPEYIVVTVGQEYHIAHLRGDLLYGAQYDAMPDRVYDTFVYAEAACAALNKQTDQQRREQQEGG